MNRRSLAPGTLLLCVIAASAQPAHPTPSPTASITLGQSVVPLNGPWRFTLGDSPIDPATHQPLWAQPSFDDSHWETIDLTPPPNSIDRATGMPGFVPGWSSKGHPGYSGYAWYRLQIKLDPQPNQKLALAGPADIDDAFQVFANGTLLGSFGKFSGHHPLSYAVQPSLFPVPLSTLSRAPDGTQLIAFRVWMSPLSIRLTAAGGIHNAPLLGEAAAVTEHYRLAWLELIRRLVYSLFECSLFFLLAIIACSLALLDRSDPVYRWLAAACLLIAIANSPVPLGWLHLETAQSTYFVELVLVDPVILGAWVMVWWLWFRLRRPVWVPTAIAALTLLFMLSDALGYHFFTAIPPPVASTFHLLSLVIRLLSIPLLIFIVTLGIRQQGREGWLAVPAVILFGIGQFQGELGALHIPAAFFPYGIRISLHQIADAVLIAVMFALMLRRLMLSLRTQHQQALDIKQAAEVQHVLIPEHLPSTPNLTIHTEYRPAREVGGDFFQIIPNPTDNTVLVVAGDVTGKGLQAGMLVSLLVGAIRTAADTTSDPLLILQTLNRRLLGRGHAQATAVALRIAPDGHATLANAGHIPPYLNGIPLDMEGALPLGMIPDADFSVLHFHLAPNDNLVLISDGILEATNPSGELYGFDRVQQHLRNNLSPSALADAAQTFGQDDDISLISLTRNPQPA